MFGIKIKEAAVENKRPPAIASAKELCGFALSGSKANGKREAIEVALVAITDENFFSPPSSNMIELFTEIPKSAAKAKTEFMFKEEPKTKRQKAAPKNAGGMAKKKSRGFIKDSVCAPRTQ